VESGGLFQVDGYNEIVHGDVIIENGGRLTVSDGKKVTLDGPGTGNLTVEAGGEVDLGTGTISADGDVSFGNGASLAIRFEPGPDGAHGTISAGSITFSGQVHVALEFDDFRDLDGKTVFDSPGGIEGGENLTFSGLDEFYELAYRLSFGSGGFTVDYLGLATAVSDIAGGKSFPLTANYRNAAALMAAIDADPAYGAVSASLYSALKAVNGVSDPVLAELALKQLIGESLLGVSDAAGDIALKTLGIVYGRLDAVRTRSTLTPPAAGGPEDLNRVWAGGFGTWARQDDRDGIYGYSFRSSGFALGYDRKVAAVEGLTLGASAAFSSGGLDGNAGLSTVDIDTFGLGLYGSYAHGSGFFVDASVSYAVSSNESEVVLVTGGRKTGSFDASVWQLGARFGYAFRTGSFAVTPSVGIRFLSYRQEAWTEKVTGSAQPGNSYGKLSERLVEIPVQIRIDGTFAAGSATVTPELRLGYTYAVKRPGNTLHVGFDGFPGQAAITGISPPRGSFQAGVGIKVETGGSFDVFANYDLNISKGYHDHRASLGVGLEF
jgi:outer membrane autotransporter protein